MDNCDGIERIPIMRLALEEINGRCDLLPGYRLVVDYANSAVSLLFKYHCMTMHRIAIAILYGVKRASVPIGSYTQATTDWLY